MIVAIKLPCKMEVFEANDNNFIGYSLVMDGEEITKSESLDYIHGYIKGYLETGGMDHHKAMVVADHLCAPYQNRSSDNGKSV